MLDAEKSAIRQEIELLRQQGARRPVLSAHACHRLFFDFGIRPSVASVRELTAIGSAGDIPRDIEAFWEQVRQASRLRAGQGVIPETLEGAAGELLGALYQAALDSARKGFDAEREAQTQATQAAHQDARDAELRLALAAETLSQAQTLLRDETTRREQAELQLAVLRGEVAVHTQSENQSHEHLRAELDVLRRQLDDRQRSLTVLQEQIDTLRAQAQANAEHYASQLKDAVDEAQRRVRPMLMELDGLRTQASTYQAGIKESSRREFDFMQQLSTTKGRADTLERLVNRQADELANLHGELAKTRERGGIQPELAQWVVDLVSRGVLSEAELAPLGRLIDGFVPLPKLCFVCRDGEPELADLDEQIEIACPECGHSSGLRRSRLEASRKFSFIGRSRPNA